MARTLEEIKSEIIAKAAEYPALSELEANTSRVPEWQYIKNVLAFMVLSVDQMVDQHKADVSVLITQQEIGLLTWYKERVLEYQHGDPLVLNANVIGYNLMDLDKQIIKHASVKDIDVNDQVVLSIKLAKDDGSGGLMELDALELAGISTYIRNIKFAGTKTLIESLPPDSVAYDITLEVDPKVLDPTGKRIDGTSDTPAIDALNAFHQAIGDDGVLYLSRVEDIIQNIEGVINARVTAGRYYDGDSWEPIAIKWESVATYMTLSEVETNLTYL